LHIVAFSLQTQESKVEEKSPKCNENSVKIKKRLFLEKERRESEAASGSGKGGKRNDEGREGC